MSDSGAPGPQPPVTPIDLVLPGAWRGLAPDRADGAHDAGPSEGGGSPAPLAPLTPVVGRSARPNDTLELPFGVVAPPPAGHDPLTRTGDAATDPAPVAGPPRMIDLTVLEERAVQPAGAAAATSSHARPAGTSRPGSGTMGAERSGRGAGGDDTPFWLQDVRPPLIREPSPVLGEPRAAGPGDAAGAAAHPAPVADESFDEPFDAPADESLDAPADGSLDAPADEPFVARADLADDLFAPAGPEDTADLHRPDVRPDARPDFRDDARHEPEEPLAPVARPFVPPVTPVLHPVTPAVPFPAPVAATPIEGIAPLPDPATAGRPVAEPVTPVPAVPTVPDPGPFTGALHLPLGAPSPTRPPTTPTAAPASAGPQPPRAAAPVAAPVPAPVAAPVPAPPVAATPRPRRGSWANEAPTEAIAVVSGGAPPDAPGRRRARAGGPGPRRVSVGGVAGGFGLLVLVSGIALPFVLTGLPDGSDSVSLTAPSVSPSPLVASATPTGGVTSASPEGTGSPDDAAPPTTVADSSTTRKKKRTTTTEPRTTTSTRTRTSTRPRTTRTTREPTPTPTPSTSETRPGQVFVDDAQYVGRPAPEARAALEALGLVVYDDWDFAPGTPRGIVVNVRPDGWVPVGSAVWIEISRG